MTGAVEDRIRTLVGSTFAPDATVREVTSPRGIIDLLAVSFDARALESRQSAGVGAVTLPMRVRALDALRVDREIRLTTLALKLGTTPDALVRSTLRPLAEDGLVNLKDKRASRSEVWRPLASHITAVELKLSKWRGALQQADNAAMCSNRAWVVLDRQRGPAAVSAADTFRAFGVGLALLDSTGALKVVVRPRRRRTTRWFRAYVAEVAWAAASAPTPRG